MASKTGTSAHTQLLQRNLNWFESGHWLLVNPANADVFSVFNQVKVSAFYQYYDDYLRAPKHISSHFGATLALENLNHDALFSGVVIYMPKSKKHLSMLLSNIAPLIENECPIMLIGENKSGIKSANKLLAEVAEHGYKVDSAKHCTLLSGRKKSTLPEFELSDWFSHYTTNIQDETLTVYSLPGVFSHENLDKATELLLNTIPHFSKQTWLDFACGSGVIGAVLAKRGNKVTLSDVSALALESTKKTLQANQLTAKVIASDRLNQIDGRFDGIITNPPFHTGIQTDYSITEDFLKQTQKHIHKSGKLYLVANSFLKYFPLIQDNFAHSDTLVKNSQFAVYVGSHHSL